MGKNKKRNTKLSTVNSMQEQEESKGGSDISTDPKQQLNISANTEPDPQSEPLSTSKVDQDAVPEIREYDL